MTFQIVMAGHCWLEVDGEEPRLLEQGSLTLIPHGTAHTIRSDPRVVAQPLFELPVEKISERYEVLRLDGGGRPTQAMYGVMHFDHHAAQRLVELLPRLVQIETRDDDASGWLQSTLRFITREAAALRPGGETVITRLSDIVVIQAIRAWLDKAPEAQRGWLGALNDQQIGRALASIHREPRRPWTVDALAREAAMSRSAFSARFTQLLDEPPMRYVTRWRMQLARARLQETSESLSTIASHLHYESESAFCRTFKRFYGVSPGSLRQCSPRSATRPTTRRRAR
jgi:AraC-like DNA-binding protein